jgi:ribosome biogenesis GTPase / thiamine phosphate phosphatase
MEVIMVSGIIIKGIAGFYYVELNDGRILECKARGKFRRDKLTPMVGDRVQIELLNGDYGVINEIEERKSKLIRPQVANVDQAIVVFALKNPEISFTLLDKLLILIEHNSLTSVICLNKGDLDDDNVFDRVREIYGNIGYTVIRTNGKTGEGVEGLKAQLSDKISVFAGPSGVGKSTIFNSLQNKVKMETGEVSTKISRGKHTTRHAELIEIEKGTFIVDTPGFSSIDLNFIEPQELQFAFKEFGEHIGECKFTSCLHHKEKDCQIKRAVEKGEIPEVRYNAYVEILQELLDIRRIKK